MVLTLPCYEYYLLCIFKLCPTVSPCQVVQMMECVSYLPSSFTCTAAQTPFYLQTLRAAELEGMQHTYLWETDPTNGLPLSLPNRIAASRLEDLPRDERPPELSDGDLAGQVAQLLAERGLSHFIGA
jgi:hypothetical protein